MKKFKSLDFFGLGVTFKVEGNEKSQSIFGASVSILCTAVILAYALHQFYVMCLYKGTDVSYILSKNVFS